MDTITSSLGNVWRHQFIDLREDPAIDILVADLDGDGRADIISGDRWYRAPMWEAAHIAGITQAIAVMDVDGDGALEVIGTRGPGLTSELCWAKRCGDGWKTFDIGIGDGDWPHGVAILEDSPVRRGIITSYHERGMHPPQTWSIPDDPTQLWGKSTLIDLAHSEEMVVVDLDGDGQSEIVAGPWWLEHVSESWRAHRFADESYDNVTRVRVADFSGNGRLDIVLTEETGDWETGDPGRGRIAYFEAPEDIRSGSWTEHVIAWKKCPHSLDLIWIDGSPAIAVAEHDAFTPHGEPVDAGLIIFHRSGSEWIEECIDTRFEHFNGCKAIDLGTATGIVSHGWMEPRYLHLWSPQ